MAGKNGPSKDLASLEGSDGPRHRGRGYGECRTRMSARSSSGRGRLYLCCAAILCACFLIRLVTGAQALTVRDLLEAKDISSLSISPDGRYLAFLIEARHLESNETELTWYVARLATGSRDVEAIADGGVPMRSFTGAAAMQSPIWSADSRWIYFRARRQGEVEVWRASPRGGAVQQVTSDPADVDGFILGPDGGRLYYIVHATRKAIEEDERLEYQRGVLLAGSLRTEEPVLYNFRRDDGTGTTMRRRRKGVYQLLCDGEPRVRVLSLRHLGSARAADETEVREYRKIANAPQISSLLLSDSLGKIILPRRRDSQVVFWKKLSSKSLWPSYQLSLHTRGETNGSISCRAEVCRDIFSHFSAPEWRPRTADVVWVSASELGGGTLSEWNTREGTVRTVFSSEARLGGTGGDERFFETGCPITAREALCVTSDASSPPEIEAINLDTGARHVIYDPNRGLRSRGLSHAQHLTWTDRWGRRHVGVLVLPPRWTEGERMPLVITSYKCGGFLEGADNRFISEFVLAEAGFAVLCTDQDVRLVMKPYPDRSVGPGIDLVDLQVMLDTWVSGVNALERRGLIDPSRVGVSGLSFSAEAVWYALTHSKLFAAAAAGNPPFMDPFNYYLQGTQDFIQGGLRLRGMQDPTEPSATAFYEKASVALNVAKISAPILEQSISSEYREGMETYLEMNRARKPYEVYIFPDEFHQRVQPQHLAAMQKRNVEWFRFWLQGYEDPSPSLLKQYARWEHLCLAQRRGDGHPTRCVTWSRHTAPAG